jgi:fatty-acyl-CoA synthase
VHWGWAVRNAGLGSWPERRLWISPDRDAIWFEGTTTSHAAFAHRVRRTAAALAGLGVAPGDRVAWTGGNHPSALETLYACGQLGAIWVPVNARLAAPEVEYVLTHSGASVVVHGLDHGALADALRGRAVGVRQWVAAEPPVDGGADSLPYEDLLARPTRSPATSRSPSRTPAWSCTPPAPPAGPRARC